MKKFLLRILILFPVFLTAQVDTLWAREYYGADSSDIARDIAVDNNGNVYVSGSCRFPGNTDIVTIKYDSAGNLQWIRQYDNPDTSGADGGME